jgi:hypothetical protein
MEVAGGGSPDVSPDSEFSLLSCPALSMLCGRLPFPTGEPDPRGPVEPGRLWSLSTLLTYSSMSSLPDGGDRIYK